MTGERVTPRQGDSNRGVLRHCHYQRFIGGKDLAEALVVLVLLNPDVPIRVRGDVPSSCGLCHIPAGDLAKVLTVVRSKGRHVHEADFAGFAR
jgi:hypothetical protein